MCHISAQPRWLGDGTGTEAGSREPRALEAPGAEI